jgi:hypothetical protein
LKSAAAKELQDGLGMVQVEGEHPKRGKIWAVKWGKWEETLRKNN